MNWKNMHPAEKIATVIACIALLFVVVPKELLPIDLTYPTIAVITVCEAVAYWKSKRKWAYLLIAGAVISLGCFILELVLL